MKPQLSLKNTNLNEKLTSEDYKKKLKPLQEKARLITHKCQSKKQSIIIVFEGWDAAGKGGAIRRLTGLIDPRLYEIHNIAAPDATERTRNYLWRFWKRIPEKGVMGIFDRSWYGRVMVERVEGFAKEEEWSRAYREIQWFEEDLYNSNIKILKFFLHVDPSVQKERFEARGNDPLKRWKLTEEDWRNREKWTLYESAIEDMLTRTNFDFAPWVVINGNDKYLARIQVLENFIQHCK
jgi:polyphosphate kinase 2 (PPK2 family)